MVLSICQSCLKLKANKQLQGITWKMWNTNNFARFNVLTAQWPIALSVIPTPFSVSVPPVLGLQFQGIPHDHRGGQTLAQQLRGVRQAAHGPTLSKMGMINTSREWGATSGNMWDTSQSASLNHVGSLPPLESLLQGFPVFAQSKFYSEIRITF